MATINWPTSAAFVPREVTWGARVPKSRWAGFFTADEQSISHLADRIALTLDLRPCNPAEGAEREALFTELVSAGHFVRLGHPLRPEPLGTLRGTPTVAATAAAGVRTVQVQGLAGDTLKGGDILSVGNQLLPVAYAGSVANGAGLLVVPLQLPLRVAVAAAAAVAWQAPTGLFQLVPPQLDFSYGRGQWQRGISLAFRERF